MFLLSAYAGNLTPIGIIIVRPSNASKFGGPVGAQLSSALQVGGFGLGHSPGNGSCCRLENRR